LISDVKRSGASVDPGSFKWKDQERNGAGHPGHDASEGLRRLVHRPPNINPETGVTDHQANKNREHEPSSEWI